MRFQNKVVFQMSKQPGVVTTNFDDGFPASAESSAGLSAIYNMPAKMSPRTWGMM